ncbi:MAG: SPOR domain-containing protein [Nitrospirae bacterium]|nr:SPOR domain-containing protein [Nitrospirota bacterium]
MKGRLFDKIGYDFIEGKGLLIVVVVLFSSASFILGFFAGKKVTTTAVAKKAESAIIEARTVKPAVPAPPAPPAQTEAAAVKPQDVPPAVKNYELVNPGEELQHADAVRPQPPHAEQIKPDQLKPEQPGQLKPAAELPRATSPTLPKAKSPDAPKRVPDTKPQVETKTPAPTPVTNSPAVKDVLTPVAPPAVGTQGTFHAAKESAKTTAKQQKIPRESPPANSGEKYFIQIGAFKNVGDAMRLQDDLKIKGFDSDVIKNPVNDGVTLFKVRVGGNFTKSEASQMMTRLNKKGIRGFMKEAQR